MYYIYGIEESDASQEKPLLYYFLFKQKQLCCKIPFYCVFIIAKSNDYYRKPFNNPLLYPPFPDVYLVDEIIICLNFQ